MQHRAGFVAILEVRGFPDWLTELLPQIGCREVVLIQAEKKSSRKTDRHDANQLGELLWLNRARLLASRKDCGGSCRLSRESVNTAGSRNSATISRATSRGGRLWPSSATSSTAASWNEPRSIPARSGCKRFPARATFRPWFRRIKGRRGAKIARGAALGDPGLPGRPGREFTKE